VALVATFRSAAAIAVLAMILGGGAAAGQDVAAEERVAALSSTVVALDRVAHLPAVLGGLDRERYRGIFVLQQGGAWEDADALIEALDNTVLMGHVLFQRYMHPTKYRSSYAELAGWLTLYADHPGAARIHRLALKRRPEGVAPPREPVAGALQGIGEMGEYIKPVLPRRDLDRAGRKAAKAVRREVLRLVRKGKPGEAEARLFADGMNALLSAAEQDALAATIARGYFVAGRSAEARAIAEPAAARSGERIGEPCWMAGLAAWRLGDVAGALRHFARLAESESDPILVSGGAYWASRAFARQGNTAATTRMLRLAATHPRTMYGQLAQASLFVAPNFSWEPPRLSQAMLDELDGAPGTWRAIALAEVGETALAEQEGRKLYARLGREAAPAILALADILALPGIQVRLGSQLAAADGRRHLRSLYPLPAWRPAEGFRIDQALILALVRQESVFEPRARSKKGARGLMQLMPRTAAHIAEDRRYRNGAVDALFAPDLNLSLGQKYVRYLLEHEHVNGNLLRLLVAYNAGPSRLGEWLARMDGEDDPLMFIENVPFRETRRFIRHVLANLWIYRDRLGERPHSLNALVAGRWPTLAAPDKLANARKSSRRLHYVQDRFSEALPCSQHCYPHSVGQPHAGR